MGRCSPPENFGTTYCGHKRLTSFVRSSRQPKEPLTKTHRMNSTSSVSARIQILDIIRGIAVLGILGMNIWSFAMPEILEDALPVTEPDRGLGYCLGMASEILLSGKMRSLFAMLLGISSVIILDRLTQKYDGLKATQIFFRRMFWLLVFGQIHGFLFLFAGDILFQYAIMGMIAFPLYYASPRIRLLVMLICLAVLTYKPYQDYVYTVDLEKDYLQIMEREIPEEELSEDAQAIIDEWDEYTAYIDPSPEDYEDEVEAKLGGYLSAYEYNQEDVVLFSTYDLHNWYAWEIMLYMLLGISLFRAGFFAEDFPTARLALVAVLGLGIGGAMHIWLHIGFYNKFFEHVASLYYLIFFDLGRLPMTLGYVALICLVFRQKLFALPGRWLAATGKMTLTNYLTQSIIAAFIFIGLRQFNELTRPQLGLIVLTIWIFQIAFSNLWMKYFIYGPFEWVWRSLTYCSVQPCKRKPAG